MGSLIKRHLVLRKKKNGVPAVFPTKTNYAPTFSGVPDGTSLRTIAGWANYSSTGSVAERLKIVGGQIAGNSINFTGPTGDTLVARDVGTTDHFIQLTLGAFIAGTDMQMVVGGTDEKNCIYLHLTFGAVTTGSFFLSKVINGVETSIQGFTTATIPQGRTPIAGDVIKLSTVGNLVFVTMNGVVLKETGTDITGFTKGTKVGFGTFDVDTTERFSNLVIGVHTGYAALDIDNTAWGFSNTLAGNNWPIFWPGKLGTGAPVTLAGNFAGSLLALEYRVRNASTNAVVKDWTRATSLSKAGSKWTAKGSYPMADNTVNPVYKIDVRAANDVDGGGSNFLPTTVGVAVLTYGQSNSENFGGAGNLLASVSYSNAYAISPHSSGAPWWAGGTAAGATNAQKAVLWAAQLSSSLGVPAGVVVSGRAGMSLGPLLTADGDPDYNSGGFWDNLVNDVNALHCNATGMIYAANLTQGEAEADQTGSFITQVTGRDVYRANITTFLSLVRGSGIAVASNIPVGITVIGQFSGDKGTSTTFANYNYPYQRETSFGLLGIDSGLYLSGSLMEHKHATGDAFHYLADSYIEIGRRNGMSMAKAMKSILGLGTYTGPDGRGPFVSSVTRAGAVITLNLTANGATGFDQTAAGNLDAYDVYLASDPNQGTGQFPTLLTKSSTVLDAANSKITITLSATPGAAVKVRSFYGHWPERDKTATPAVNAEDVTAIRARGTYADGTKIAVEPIYSAITSN